MTKSLAAALIALGRHAKRVPRPPRASPRMDGQSAHLEVLGEPDTYTAAATGTPHPSQSRGAMKAVSRRQAECPVSPNQRIEPK